MTHSFDADTSAEPLGDGRFAATISRDWWIVEGPNGGYLAALALRGLQAAVADAVRTPRSLTIHYTTRPAEGAAVFETTVERTGRSMTTVSGRLVQGERTIAVALGAFSSDRLGYEYGEARMPEVAPPEQCPGSETAVEFLPPMMQRLDMRWALGNRPFSGAPAGDALVGAWLRLNPSRVADAATVAMFTDVLPPALFATTNDPTVIGSLPTVDLTVHFRNPVPADARPDDWYLGVTRSRQATGGFVDEDAEIWTSDGLLLAHSRQIMVVR